MKIRYRDDVRFDVTTRVYFQREGRGEKLLKVVSSKALSDVRASYTLFLTTTQFYSRTLAWLPWLFQGHLSLIFHCSRHRPHLLPHQPLPLPRKLYPCFSLFRSTRSFRLLIPCGQKLPFPLCFLSSLPNQWGTVPEHKTWDFNKVHYYYYYYCLDYHSLCWCSFCASAGRKPCTQVNHSVHTLGTFLRIRADPSMQIFWISVIVALSDTFLMFSTILIETLKRELKYDTYG